MFQPTTRLLDRELLRRERQSQGDTILLSSRRDNAIDTACGRLPMRSRSDLKTSVPFAGGPFEVRSLEASTIIAMSVRRATPPASQDAVKISRKFQTSVFSSRCFAIEAMPMRMFFICSLARLRLA